MHRMFLIISTILLGAVGAHADDKLFSFGGDTYVTGRNATISSPVERDAFVAGYKVTISGPVSGDAHAMGRTVNISGDVTKDVYATGADINLSGTVGEDITAFGADINLTGPVQGNVRLAGADISIQAPIAGSAAIGGASITIGSTIAGDVDIGADNVTFTDGAKISGQLTIRSPNDIIVPESVASADRVTIEIVERADMPTGPEGISHQSMRSFWPSWLPGMFAIVIFSIVGLVWLGLFPKRSWLAYQTGMAKPLKSVLFGVLALAALIGLIPAIAITVIGIPLVPVVIVALIIMVILGYTAGSWAVAVRILKNFNLTTDKFGGRILALVAGLLGAWALSFIPFAGWFIQLGLMFFGLGFIALSALARWIDSDFHEKLVAKTSDA